MTGLIGNKNRLGRFVICHLWYVKTLSSSPYPYQWQSTVWGITRIPGKCTSTLTVHYINYLCLVSRFFVATRRPLFISFTNQNIRNVSQHFDYEQRLRWFFVIVIRLSSTKTFDKFLTRYLGEPPLFPRFITFETFVSNEKGMLNV